MIGRVLKRSRRLRGVPKSPHPTLLKVHEKEQGKYSQWFLEDLLPPPEVKYVDHVNKHQRFVRFDHGHAQKQYPRVHNSAFVAPSATLCGDVEIWNKANIWYGVVIKSETTLVRIGYCSNIQDGTTIKDSPEEINHDHDGSTIVGHHVTVGHNCILESCTIEDQCLIGMNCVLPEGSYVESGSMLAAGTVLEKNQRIPSGQVWGGSPARYIRDVVVEEQDSFKEGAENYYRNSLNHKDEFYLESDAYKQAEKEGIKIGYKEAFPW
eukprot:TRINITY_DN2562_c0_g1_i1.p1 TRINITY_DN2562_c0_g1~~TRINITY_DN2562_c0_g1_i1.p1  ORF type:complete len:265 (-),score=61.59 TRINITY_DN2562_c0_g1_i1:48-842(-)